MLFAYPSRPEQPEGQDYIFKMEAGKTVALLGAGRAPLDDHSAFEQDCFGGQEQDGDKDKIMCILSLGESCQEHVLEDAQCTHH